MELEGKNHDKKDINKISSDGPKPPMAVNFEEGGQYDPDEAGKREMKIAVKDNLVLQEVRVEVGGEGKRKGKCKHQGGDNYSFQMESKNTPQNVTVIARDQDGNETLLKVEDVLISDDPLARFINNKRAFWMTVFGVLVLAGGISALCVSLLFLARPRNRMVAQGIGVRILWNIIIHGFSPIIATKTYLQEENV